MPGAMGTVFQALCMPGITAPFPVVESLRRDAKIAAGKSGIVLVKFIVVKPLKSLPGFL
jgi:hypothetical protein